MKEEAAEDEILEEDEVIIIEKGAPTRLSKKLNRYFHHLDRGGTLKGEVLAGITMFFISICVIFMNVQIVGNTINGTLELSNSPADPKSIQAASVYVQIYVGSILIAVLGSLLIGLITKLPLTQLSAMGMASSLLCLVGTETGLTYNNLLFINFAAALVYCIVAGVPKIRNWLYGALPSSVRKALPAAGGLILAYGALQLSGIVSAKKVSLGSGRSQYITMIDGFGFSDMRTLTLCGLIGAAGAVILYCAIKALHRKHPVFWSMTGGTLLFVCASLMMSGIDTSNSESFINFGRVWMIAGSQASNTTPFADSYLTYFSSGLQNVFSNVMNIFTEGTDFSAYTGSTISLLAGGVLCYVFTGLYAAEGTLLAMKKRLNCDASEEGKVEFDSQDGIRKALLCNAGTNLIGSFLGAGGITISKTSVAAADDNGKSGITSIVASIGFLISLFILVFPALFATTTYPVSSMNEWNYFAYGNGGFIYLVQGAGFAVADAVLLCTGLFMLSTLKEINWKKAGEWLPAVVTAGAALLTTNIAIGVACGMVPCLLTELVIPSNKRSSLNIPMIVLLALLIIMLILL